MFIVYNVVHRWKVVLEYSLFVKTKLWTEIKELIKNLIHDRLITFIKK